MSNERLERIKRESKGVVWNTETDEDLLTELDTPDFNWLIEQAEQNKSYRDSINLALSHIHTGNFTLATVELNKALSKGV